MGQKLWSIQLHDHLTREVIQDAGGVAYIAAAGGTAKVAIVDEEGAAASNPVSITNGLISFRTAETVASVDIYGKAPSGHPFRYKTVKPSGLNEIYIDRNALTGVLVIPFDIADTDDNTQTDTGFDLEAGEMILPQGLGVYVETLDATETMDVGLGIGTEAGFDANGIMAAMALTLAGMAQATVGFDVGTNAVFVDLTGGDVEFTYGALVAGAGTIAAVAEGSNTNEDEGMYVIRPHIGDGTCKSIDYTLSSGTDTAAGFIVLPLQLAVF
jgi:hypothetical protein